MIGDWRSCASKVLGQGKGRRHPRRPPGRGVEIEGEWGGGQLIRGGGEAHSGLGRYLRRGGGGLNIVRGGQKSQDCRHKNVLLIICLARLQSQVH